MRTLRVLPLALLALSCATSPTGRKQLILLPDAQVAALGATAFDDIKKNERVSTDAALTAYVNCVAGAIVAANRDRVRGAWEVTTFESDQINAFALPGQKIGVYSGMARFADDADQLAAVVGHEIGHVLAQHGNERMSQGLVAQGGMAVIEAGGSLLDLYEPGSETQQILMAGLGLGYELGVAKPFSRTQESEADEIGLELMAKAGFDPQGAVALWRKMAQLGDGGPEFLSTHPAPQNRAQALSAQQAKVAPLYAQAQRAGRNPSCPKPASARTAPRA